MAKTKQGKSAAQRREQVRQQRQNSLNEPQKIQPKVRSRARKSGSNWGLWVLLGSVVVAVAVVIGVFAYISNQSVNKVIPSDPKVFKAVTHVSPSVLDSVAAGGVQNPMQGVPSSAGPLKGPDGKPEFFYMGAEYCPFCAAQRWAMVVALSRFGTFSPLSQLKSSEDNVPTFTFHNSTYTSQYIDFVSVETQDNSNNTLESPTTDEAQLANKYDATPYTSSQAAGSIPFIDIANLEVSSGSYYDPGLLTSSSWEDIANQLNSPSSDIARNILGAANDLTAVICDATQNKPANVCDTTIQQIESSLPPPPSGATFVGAGAAGIVQEPFDAVRHRQD